MFMNYCKKEWIRFLFFTMILVSAILCGMFLGRADSKQYEKEMVVATVTFDSASCADTAIWYLCLSEWPESLRNGKTFAVLFRFELSDGWRISSVQGFENSVWLTWEDTVILLDGPLAVVDQSDSSIMLRIEIRKYRESQEDCRFQGISDDDNLIYYVDESGRIDTCPYQIRSSEEETENPAITEELDTVSDANETETLSFASESEKPTPWNTPVYAGCQETTVISDVYAVRFFFVGQGTPVICMEGGGFLSMKISQTDIIEEWTESRVKIYKTANPQGWSVCTFRNLSVYRDYVFFIYEQERIIRIRYTNGRFMGENEVKLYT